MGNMTKYLKQSAVVEHCTRDNLGQPTLDDYGRPSFESPVVLKCRREKYVEKSTTSLGHFVNVSSVYYFDETANIRQGDRVDEHEVQHVESYVLGSGVLVGYEVYV